MNFINIILGEKNLGNKEFLLYNFFYINFKNKKSKFMVLDVRIMVMFEGLFIRWIIGMLVICFFFICVLVIWLLS